MGAGMRGHCVKENALGLVKPDGRCFVQAAKKTAEERVD